MTININKYPLLRLINEPEDLRSMPVAELPAVAHELRQYLLACVSQSSGHFASGLGAVELTVALHYVYNTPFDQIIWDVGHQAYPHKILTGRREQIHTIRQLNGLHPFPWREESEYDTLSVGHSSTSISAALGIAIAAEQEKKNRQAVAIIGDGAITAGMAFEALNHAGDLKKNMLVILNDNDMSISENVGALNQHLAKLLSGSVYTSFREGGKKILSGLPPIKELASKAEEHLKGMIAPGTIFEELGFNYIGPIDGHDVQGLVETLKNMRSLKGPQFLHIITKKGKGYHPAEQDPIGYHAVPKFDLTKSELPSKKPQSPTYSQIFGQWLCDIAKQDPKLMAITPAMREGSGMVKFSREYPKQYFDTAIAEQHAVTLAAGMAIQGLKPVVAIYSTFLQRGYDQLIHDVALQNLPVLFAVDRAGIVGADGPTHQGTFDISYLRCIPNLIIMTPSDENECRQMLNTGYQANQPAVVRYPRGQGPQATIDSNMAVLPIGQANKKMTGEHIALLNFGHLGQFAERAAQTLNASYWDMRFVKPIDEQAIIEAASQHKVIVTIEDNCVQGGAGSAVLEVLAKNKLACQVLQIGVPDEFVKHGTQAELYQILQLDEAGIIQQINRFIQA
ncbi:1-deoxy-D-xylulose-5-phosphate synthase [Catenovulum agarivorans DS-2]|uniref:1-deoxy-D-xylulose-5-phosphate synthase n=1 Tax=Catenovulum agarivorans DS-2 TaxID=1328313 RepID=W7QU55_9ALTE|nr:1-deoxy-D-xylulose-5-phosphate synthase [Catenovulum agarivorans]EWH11368.1 1-deoxy-D-xylulose-5-phosphate synthase [Catenovulum agarivorans DS-2]